MNRLTILGVCPLSDYYPSIKYRLPIIEEIFPDACARIIYEPGVHGFYRELNSGNRFGKVLRGLVFTFANLWVFIRFLFARTEKVYLCYPGILLALLFSFLPAGIRPKIYLDGFISLFDTAVNDRTMFTADSLIARMLFKLEARAFRTARRVIVDTHQNARFYSKLYSLPLEMFTAVPLSIPRLRERRLGYDSRSGKFVCIFIGSMVPLQGIEVILEAARLTSDVQDLEFHLIGDGQEGTIVNDYLKTHDTRNLHWTRRMLPVDEVVTELQTSSLCLGIFGTTAKAQRVIPYKLYYYMALGLPFVSMDTPALREIITDDNSSMLLDNVTSQILSDRIRDFCIHPEKLQHCAKISAPIYDSQLAPDIIREKLMQAFEEYNA